jgi:multiple sugar transport system substrate-binding protein
MSSRWMRSGLALALAALFVGVLTAVASAKPSESAAGAQPQTIAAGTLNIYGYGPGDDIQENRASYAARQMSDTDINRPAGDFNDQVFLTRLASGDVPDLVRMSRPRVGTYAARGVLRPVGGCISQAVRKLYRVGALRAMTYKGQLYGLPEFTQPVTLTVNRSAANAAGVSINDISTTNKRKLLAATKKLVKISGGDLQRIGFDPKIDSFIFFQLWLRWFGNKYDVVSANGLKAQLNTPQAVAALAYGVQLINAQGGWNRFNTFRNTFNFFGRDNPFVRDQLGASPLEAFFYNQFSNNSPDVDIVAKFFTNRKGGPISVVTGNGWVVPKATKNAAAACAYMKQVTSTQAWLSAAKQRYDARKRTGATFMGLYTANAEADRKILEDIYQSFGKEQFDRAVRVLVAAGRFGFEMPPSPGGAQIVDATVAAIQRALNGQQTPKQALDQAQREAQRAIDANK